MKKILTIIIIFIASFSYSQNYKISKKAQKYFQTARHYYELNEFQQAIYFGKKAIKKEKNYFMAYLLLSQIYSDINQPVNSAYYLQKALQIDRSFIEGYVYLAQEILRYKNYDSAALIADFAIKKINDTAINYKELYLFKAKKLKKDALFRKQALKNPKKIEIFKLPPQINTQLNEYFPSLSADGKKIYFTRLMPVGYYTYEQEDIFYSEKKGDSWTVAKPLPKTINTLANNEGAHTFSPDGKIMIFTRCISDCDLYITKLKNGKWSKPQKLPYPINTKYWDSQPCLASDGKTLYFTSNRPGGKGGKDIWKTTYLGNNRWSKPVNLKEINTPLDEMSPFLHPDKQTLYFSSNGYYGLGGYDLYISRLDSNKKWSPPINLGYPINSEQNDYRLAINYLGDIAFFSSAKDSDNQDIYYFYLPDSLRPQKTIYLKVEIFNQKTNQPLISPYLIVNLSDKDTIYSDTASNFIVNLPFDKIFALNLTPKGFMFYSENINLKETPDTLKFINKKIYLQPIENNQKFILQNLFFDFNSFKIKETSFFELDRLYEFLKTNPQIKIKIQGHTDTIGGYEYNMNLSKMRAKAVADYLISKGIEPSRIQYEGYGYTKPIASNATEEGRKQNRRVEILIIKK